MKKRKIDKSELEKFQKYIFEMDDVLKEFVEELMRKGFKLDFSIESLGEIEKIVTDYGIEKSDEIFLNKAASYIGEVFRKNIGGNWDLCHEISNAYDGLPVIVNFADLDMDFCPLAILGNYVVHRKSGLLIGAVESNREFGKK